MVGPVECNPQITDGVTQANVTTLGSGPAVSTVQTLLSLSQAQGVLFANMVNNQQQLSMAGHAAITEGVIQLLSLSASKSNDTQSIDDAINKLADVLQTSLSKVSANILVN